MFIVFPSTFIWPSNQMTFSSQTHSVNEYHLKFKWPNVQSFSKQNLNKIHFWLPAFKNIYFMLLLKEFYSRISIIIYAINSPSRSGISPNVTISVHFFLYYYVSSSASVNQSTRLSCADCWLNVKIKNGEWIFGVSWIKNSFHRWDKAQRNKVDSD